MRESVSQSTLRQNIYMGFAISTAVAQRTRDSEKYLIMELRAYQREPPPHNSSNVSKNDPSSFILFFPTSTDASQEWIRCIFHDDGTLNMVVQVTMYRTSILVYRRVGVNGSKIHSVGVKSCAPTSIILFSNSASLHV